MNMKHTVLTLTFFIACGTLLWSNPDDTKASLAPFTGEIANNTQNLKELQFFLSKPLSITPPEQNNASKKFEVNEGALVTSEHHTSADKLEFNTTDAGTLRTIETASESLVILFKDTPLKFKKNPQGRYELFSVEIDNKTHILRPTRFEDGLPQLYIKKISGTNDRLEMRAVPDSEPSGRQHGGQPYQKLNTGNSARQFGGYPSRYIDGQSYVHKKGITAYVLHQNPYVNRGTLNCLIDTYIAEAGIEGINLDIAIAQMLYATNFLRSQRMTTHNYGGLSEQTPGWNGRFYDMTTGVRAHIQHLKGYASTRLNGRCVDPRYQVLVSMGYCGNVRTFEQLFRAWTAGSAHYEYSINGILNGLYWATGY